MPLFALLCLLAGMSNSGDPGVGESAQHDGAATSLGVSALLERVRTRAARASPPAAIKARPQPVAGHPSPGWAWDIAAEKRAESRTRLAAKNAREVAPSVTTVARERAQRMGDVGGRKMDLAGADGESKADAEISPALSKELTHVISRIVSKVIRGPRCASRRLAHETFRVGVGLPES